MRFTRKVNNEHCNYDIKKGHLCDAFNKLGQLEDIEEELGIDLVLFCNVMKNQVVYVKGKEPEWADLGTKKDIQKYWVCYFSKEKLYVQFGKDCSEHCIDNPLSEYGKTWALTKEELECKNT